MKRAIDHSFGVGSGIPTRPRRAAPVPIETRRVNNLPLALEAPLHVVSEPNQRDNRWKRSARTKDQRVLTSQLCDSYLGRCLWLGSPALRVKLVRIGARLLDDDNLAAGFKAVRDGMADWLGVKDNDARLTWEYSQEKRGNAFGIRIELAPREP